MPEGIKSVQYFYSHTPMPFFINGTKPEASLWQNIKAVLGADYTIWAAFLGSTFTTLATHGTDQDMVQRMLTAQDYKKSRLSLILSGLADLPIGFIFLTIGILLYLFFQQQPDPNLPQKNSEIFAYFILTKMPAGLRGLLIAGIFATAMGSLSAALNALSTSATRDFSHSSEADTNKPGAQRDEVKVARQLTFVFAFLMILVASATAYFVIDHPTSRIIPIVLGIFGYTYGSLLGVFLLGLLSKRGSDRGNLIAMVAGATLVACLPQIAFPWRVMFGSLTTMAIGSLFNKETTNDLEKSLEAKA
jgi:Na+/proline symporter